MIKNFDIDAEYKDEKLVIALGFFDAIHIGHKAIFDNAIALANKLDAKVAIFTFSENPYTAFNVKRYEIFNFKDRCDRYQKLGADFVISAKANKDIFDLSGDDFLSMLTSHFNVVGLVSGKDFRYGKKAGSDINDLMKYASKNNIAYEYIDLLDDGLGHKISSTLIVEMLENGDVFNANRYLALPYSIKGIVLKGRGDGSKFNTPTANMEYQSNVVRLKAGVYYTKIIVDGKVYKGLTNVGDHPTFGDMTFNIESFLLDFSSDIYKKEIEVQFIDYIRGIYKFENKEALYKQIAYDESIVRSRND